MSKSRKSSKKSKKAKTLLITIIVLVVLLFILTPEEIPVSNQANIVALELPEDGFDGQILSHTGYTLKYSEDDEQPYWVAYELTSDEIYGDFERKDHFRSDPSVQTGSAALSDYRSSGYDRGHLIPAADQNWSEEAMDDSFFLSNMSPQEPSFNRGIWAKLESVVRTFAKDNKSLYVVTGPILIDGPYDSIGNNKVSIPNYYYKVILDYTSPGIKSIGFILPNEGSSKDLVDFATSVDEVESKTNIDFFYKLPDSQEDSIESSFNVDDWNFKTFYSSAEDKQTQTTSPTTVTEDNSLYYQIQGLLYSLFGELKTMLIQEIKAFI